ncbi:MAG: threonine synthase [Thermoplasmatota archaeon]
MPAFGLVCKSCGRGVEAGLASHCTACFGPLEVRYDIEQLRNDAAVSRGAFSRGGASLWRWAPLLPFSDVPPVSARVDLGAGGRPLRRARKLGAALGLRDLWILDDSVNPTFSFKDRATSVAATKAREFGLGVLACASTGNLAASVAAHAAVAGLASVVIVPEGIEAEKVAQAAAYGAAIVRVKGGYDVANRLAQVAGDERGWGVVNVNLRPYYVEGSSTLAYDTAASLDWSVPDAVVHPIAAGASLAALARGFDLLKDLSITHPAEGPRLFGVQPAGVAPVARAFVEQKPVRPWERIDTIAQSLAIARPADGEEALARIRSSGGAAVGVDDAAIVDSIRLLARTEGILTEPAGGTTLAGLRSLVEAGTLRAADRVVLNITGNGLKTPDVWAQALPTPIAPTLDAIDEALGQLPARLEVIA